MKTGLINSEIAISLKFSVGKLKLAQLDMKRWYIEGLRNVFNSIRLHLIKLQHYWEIKAI